MSRTHIIRILVVALALVLLASLAPTVGAQTRSGNWFGWYFNGILDSNICFNPDSSGWSWRGPEQGDISWYWREGTSPRPGFIGNENYTICWQAWYYFPNDGNYTFYAMHDDGINIWLDTSSNPMMGLWYDTGPTTDTSTHWVSAGTHRVIVAYYNHTNAGLACVGIVAEGAANPLHCPYVPPTQAPTPVPGTVLGTFPTVIINNSIVNIYGPYGGYTPPPSSGSSCVWYRVLRGDTLALIARRYGMSWVKIAQDNRIPNPNFIYAGQLLRICR